MSTQLPNDLSPEQLLALVNSGASISEMTGSLLPSPSPTTVSEQSQTETKTSSSGALGLRSVKHEDSSPSAVAEDLSSSPDMLSPIGPSDGSSVDNSVTQIGIGSIPKAPSQSSGTGTNTTSFDGLLIKNPIELLLLLDEVSLDPNSTKPKLHDWQMRFMLDFADERHNKDNPFQAVAQTCNSSGKDKYIIAACAVWICMRYKETLCPITSSSGVQLDRQTCTHITRLCNKSNSIFGKLWLVQNRYFEFQHIGEFGEPMPSIITCFATDEAGKAEGYHPVEAGRRMAMFTSETKSIPPDIIDALERCSGFTHRVDASSPGVAAGYFYNVCSSALPRTDVDDIKGLDSTQVILYKVTAYECSHISNAEIERIAAKLPGGKSSSVFRSSVMAEFGSTDEMVVIPSNFVWRSVENLPKRKDTFGIVWIEEDHNEAGLDLSDGGAETVLAVRNGNRLIGLDAFRFEDTEDSLDYLEERFRFWKLTTSKCLIRGDYVGMGGPMLRALKRRNWSNIRFVDSRNKAAEPATYANRGTELFFNMRELFQNKDVIIFYDKLLIDQLCTRYYKLREGKIYQLLSKLEQKAKGFASPDRADAVNLCFWNYRTNKKYQDNPEEEKVQEVVEEDKEEVKPVFDIRAWANRDNPKFVIERAVWKDSGDDDDDIRDAVKQYNQQLTRN